MTNEEAKKMLKAKLECLKNETSGVNYGCNMRLCEGCSLNYEQGNIGEQKEALEMAIKALEQQPSEDCISRAKALDTLKTAFLGMSFERYKKAKRMFEQLPSVTPRTNLAETSQDCISRQKALDCFEQTNTRQGAKYAIETLPSVTPKYTDEEIDKAQAVEQAYVDKMVELAVEESRKKWLNSFDTSSATKCFEAVNLLKQRLEGDE